jgi:tellurite resistance protein TehA-like permease
LPPSSAHEHGAKAIYIVTRYKWLGGLREAAGGGVRGAVCGGLRGAVRGGPRRAARGMVLRAVRDADPRCFAMVMATGIVSVALRLAGHQDLSVVLLWAGIAAFAVLIAASAWRVAAFGSQVHGELGRPNQLFSYFTFPAAASVLGARLAGDGPSAVVAVLTAVTAVAWIALCGVVLAFLASWAGPRRAITDVNGSWQLWVVGTQATAIAATSADTAGVLPGRLAAWAAVVIWAAGAALYPVVTALVVTRLRVAGLRPGEPFAPYWVTMGAASITMLGAAQALQVTQVVRSAGLTGFRPGLSDLDLVFWSVATGLIPALAVFGAVRWRRGLAPRGFRREWWMIVFPAGMYATASMRTGVTAGVPAIRDTGTAAAWIAAALWAAIFVWMIGSTAARLRTDLPPASRRHGPGGLKR